MSNSGTSPVNDPVRTLAEMAAAIATGRIRVVDLTVPLEPATPIIRLPAQFAPSRPFQLQEISRYDDRGPAWYWNNFSCGEHTGTHLDAPVHWVTGKDHPDNAPKSASRGMISRGKRSSSKHWPIIGSTCSSIKRATDRCTSC